MYDPMESWASVMIGSMMNERAMHSRERQPYVNKFKRKNSKKKSTAALKKSQQRATKQAIQNAKSATTKGN